MLVNNERKCHIHKKGCNDFLWTSGNIIETNGKFESIFVSDLKQIDEILDVKEASMFGDAQRRSEEFLKRREKSGLTFLMREEDIIAVFERETALERVRTLKYSHLPSRLTSIWLIDENGVKYWKYFLSNPGLFSGTETYDVSVTGNLFHTSDLLIPDDTLSYEEMLKESEYYWNPDKSDLGNKEDEYLFQGKVKVLGKRKRRLFR